jgi:mycothiol synthase
MELPEGFTTRALELSDLDTVFGLSLAYDMDVLGEPDIDKADIAALWSMPNFDLAQDARVVFEGPVPVAWAELVSGKYIEVCVHPAYRGRGLGTALAGWSEDRARSAGVLKVFQSAPLQDEAALETFAARGYERAWTSWVLALPADVTVPQRELPDGYAIRSFQPGRDEHAAYEVIQTAFGEWPDRTRTPFEDWSALVLGREGFHPDNLLVATFQDLVIGACHITDGDEVGWVQSVAVDKAHRNRGIAQVLLAKAFEGTRSRGLERAELATDARTGALGLYENLGMQVTRTYEDWSLEL